MAEKLIPVLSVLILVQCALVYSETEKKEEDFVNPNDLFSFDSVNMRMKDPTPKLDTGPSPVKQDMTSQPSQTDNTSSQSEEKSERIPGKSDDCSHFKKPYSTINALLRQYVMTIVHMVESKIMPNTGPANINLRVTISHEEVTKLRAFGEGKTSDVHDVHETLAHMVQFASDVIPPESTLNWLEARMGLSALTLFQILAIVLSVLWVVKTLPNMRITWGLISRALFFIFVISVVFTWLELYQKEVADQEKILMERMSDHCPKPEELSLLTRMTSYISSAFTFQDDKCRDYYHALLVSPSIKVSPMEAVAVAVVKTICAPLEIIGKGVRTLLVALLKDLPVQYQMYVLIVLVVLVILIPFLYWGYQVQICHLFSIGPSQTQRQTAIHQNDQTPALECPPQCQGCSSRHVKTQQSLPGREENKESTAELHRPLAVQASTNPRQNEAVTKTVQSSARACQCNSVEDESTHISDALAGGDSLVMNQLQKLSLNSKDKDTRGGEPDTESSKLKPVGVTLDSEQTGTTEMEKLSMSADGVSSACQVRHAGSDPESTDIGAVDNRLSDNIGLKQEST